MEFTTTRLMPESIRIELINMEKNEIASVRSFPQIAMRNLLPGNGLKRIYSLLTNNKFSFDLINTRYADALPRMQVPVLSSAGSRVVSDLKMHGIAFATWPEFFDMTLYDHLRSEFDRHLTQFNKLTPASKGKAVFIDTIYKSHIFDVNDVVSSYLGSPQFAAIAASYMGMVPRFVGTSFWRTRPAPASERIYSQIWHRDYNDRKMLKIFVYLSDVGSNEGFFEYLSDSHWGGSLGSFCDKIGKDGYREYPSHKMLSPLIDSAPIVDLSKVDPSVTSGANAPWHGRPSRIQCLAPKATFIFADTFGLHRGGHVIEGHRDMVMTTYSTNFNVHKPHFSVTKSYSNHLDQFMRMTYGLH
jgi:hypothetical protein